MTTPIAHSLNIGQEEKRLFLNPKMDEGSIWTLPQVVQKIWRISLSILAIFIGCFDFLTFPWKETKKLMTSAYNSMKGGQIDPSPEKTSLKKPSLIKLNQDFLLHLFQILYFYTSRKQKISVQKCNSWKKIG